MAIIRPKGSINRPEGGVDQGEVAIQKPGQIRFVYRPPSPVSIVATGGSVYVKNARLNTVDRYDLSDTPLGLLVKVWDALKAAGYSINDVPARIQRAAEAARK